MNILILDDDLRISEFLKRGLEAETHTVEIATTPQQGWQILEKGRDGLIIVDVFLGVENGLDFCRQIRQQNETIFILVMTAKDSVEMPMEAKQAGANGYLSKPFAFDDLLHFIHTFGGHYAK